MLRFVRIIFIFVMIASIVLINPAYAQDERKIVYGEPVTAFFEKADQHFYVFEGKEKDLIYILPVRTETFSTMSFEIDLRNSRGRSVGTLYDEVFYKFIVAELPADDVYTISLKSDEAGRYALILNQTVDLLPGVSAKGQITPDTFAFFRVLSPQTVDIRLEYVRTRGNFGPHVRVRDFGGFLNSDIAGLFGSNLDSGTIEFTAEANRTYIVIVGKDILDFSQSLARGSVQFEITSSKAN